MDTQDTCPFLQIPTELRLLIYSFALLDTPAITIGSAELVGSHPDIVHRLYGNHRTPFAGIPTNHEPVIEPHYKPTLLSITQPAIIPLPPALSVPLEENEPYSSLQHHPHLSLRLTNKTINSELTSHFALPANRRTSLFVSYPHGLHVLKTLTPGLVRQARSLHLAGIYTSKSFNASVRACVGSGLPASYHAGRQASIPFLGEGTYNGNIIPPTASTLGNLITSLFGPNPTQHSHIHRLELRIYYPGSDSYSTVWGDDGSPTVIALRSIYAGEISIEVWRGQKGTGVYLSATKPGSGSGDGAAGEEGLRKRVVSTTWKRLEEGRRGEPKPGSWVVDPRWPEWEESGLGEGEGKRADCIVSTLV